MDLVGYLFCFSELMSLQIVVNNLPLKLSIRAKLVGNPNFLEFDLIR